jgi:hypothetical protein
MMESRTDRAVSHRLDDRRVMSIVFFRTDRLILRLRRWCNL